jgi:hypothetical protein
MAIYAQLGGGGGKWRDVISGEVHSRLAAFSVKLCKLPFSESLGALITHVPVVHIYIYVPPVLMLQQIFRFCHKVHLKVSYNSHHVPLLSA